jgi:DNA-binding transcriptional regulator GbsR (MarR family)
MARKSKLHGWGKKSPVQEARATLLEGVGAEIAGTFPGLTRLGGQIVVALFMADEARTSEELAGELDKANSNVFTNLRALEAAGIAERRRVPGTRRGVRWSLRGPYPDILIAAFAARLRHTLVEKRKLVERSLEALGATRGPEAESLRTRLGALLARYDAFDRLSALLPAGDGLELLSFFERSLGLSARRKTE